MKMLHERKMDSSKGVAKLTLNPVRWTDDKYICRYWIFNLLLLFISVYMVKHTKQTYFLANKIFMYNI